MSRETTLVIAVVMALVLVGVLMVYSATAVGGNAHGLLYRQLRFAALGIAAMLFAMRFDYRRLADPPIFRGLVLVCSVLLLLVLVPGIGLKVDGARRWLFGFQPSELAKVALIVLLAVKLTENREHAHEFFKGFMPPVLIALSFAVLVLLERDLGIPVMMMGVAFLMMCVAGIRWRYLVASVAPLAGAVYLMILVAPHRVERLLAFVNPWEYREGAGWQVIQSMSGFAQGGVFGRGAGGGEQKLGYLPAAHTDFIFSVVGEELGLVGSLCIVALFAALVYATYRIASNAPDLFGALLASGIGGLLVIQAAFVMAVTTGLLPTKGLPLPFVSYGGTALVVSLGMVGILVNVGVQARPPAPKRRLVPAAVSR